MRVGDLIRDRYGSWMLWRVVGVFAPESLHVLAVKVCDSKTYHRAGEHEVLPKARYQVERDPLGFLRRTRGCWGAFVDPARRCALAFTTASQRETRGQAR